MNIHKTTVCKMRTCGALLVMACFNAPIGNAQAAVPGEPRQMVVQFADLDVSRTAGIAILYRRIASAAREACQPLSERDLSQVIGWHLCIDHAIARAVGDLGIPALTGYYLAKTGRTGWPNRVAKQP
jgi:UrcA family protein